MHPAVGQQSRTAAVPCQDDNSQQGRISQISCFAEIIQRHGDIWLLRALSCMLQAHSCVSHQGLQGTRGPQSHLKHANKSNFLKCSLKSRLLGA